MPFGDLFNFNVVLNDIVVDPTSFSQAQFAQDLMQFDVKSYTLSNGEHFVFKIHSGGHGLQLDAGRQLFAEYASEIRPHLVLFLDYGLCIRDNPMDGIWVTVQDLMDSLKPALRDKFKNHKIKGKAQESMKEIFEKLELSPVFVTRSILSAYYQDEAGLSMARQKMYIEPVEKCLCACFSFFYVNLSVTVRVLALFDVVGAQREE